MVRIVTILLVVMANWIHLQAAGDRTLVAPRIAPFKGDAKAAFSYTFDDGFAHQVENALKVINPLGIRGTFFVMPLSIEKNPEKFVSWERLREIQAMGHEIGTHASITPKLHEVEAEVAASIINGGWSLIRDKVGVAPVSFAYPGGSRRDVPELQSIVAQHHYFVREKAVGYGSTDFRNWTPEGAQAQVLEAIDKGEWLVSYVHAIIDGYSPFKSIEEFDLHSRWLLSQEEKLWIAPMGEVGRYVGEFESAQLEVVHSTDRSVKLKLSCGLEPEEIYNEPLTVVLDVPDEVVSASACLSEGGETIPVELGKGKILLDISPQSGVVYVEWDM